MATPEGLANSILGLRISSGPYAGQKYDFFYENDAETFPGWIWVRLTDENGHVAEREIRAEWETKHGKS